MKKLLVGVTGGSGNGKSVVCSEFEKAGFYLIDCDKISREITRPNQPALEQIKKVFGKEYISSDGTLLRKKLGGLVFSDKAALCSLNNIISSFISNAVKEEIKNSPLPMICLDAPLLIEYGMDLICDKVVAVISDKSLRIKRICERDMLSLEEAKNRINSQKEDSFYLEKADFIVYNNTTEENLVNEVGKIIDKLRELL